MSIQEKQEVIRASEELIDKFEKQAAEAVTEEEEYAALGMLHMVKEQYEQFKQCS